MRVLRMVDGSVVYDAFQCLCFDLALALASRG
jgi:hypothetical protein